MPVGQGRGLLQLRGAIWRPHRWVILNSWFSSSHDHSIVVLLHSCVSVGDAKLYPIEQMCRTTKHQDTAYVYVDLGCIRLCWLRLRLIQASNQTLYLSHFPWTISLKFSPYIWLRDLEWLLWGQQIPEKVLSARCSLAGLPNWAGSLHMSI